MAKGKKTGGRTKGSQNKLTAEVKAALEMAFNKLGGVQALVDWGKGNRTEFYTLWVKLLPKNVELAGKDGEPLTVKIVTYGNNRPA